MITHIRHIGIVVADLTNTLVFWRDVLGFRVVSQLAESGPHLDAMTGLRDVKITTVKLAAPDGSLVELLHFDSHPDLSRWAGTPYSTGLTHIALTVEDIEAECTRLGEAGVKFNSPPQRSPDGAVKVTYGSGPEGLLLELVQVLTK